MDTIVDFIRTRRKKAGLSQVQLAEKAGVSLRALRDLEQGRPRAVRIDTLNKILRMFGKSVGIADLKR